MRAALTAAALSLTVLCSACAPPQYGVRVGGVWSEPGYGRWRGPGYGHDFAWHPGLNCDAFGRCWRRDFDDDWPGYRFRHRTQVPRWADHLPDHARARDRFLQLGPGIVCDRTTRVCYEDRKVHRRATEKVFGERAADRAREVRDALGTPLLFVPRRGVACDRERHVCVEGGQPDRGLTRRYFGRDAADALSPDRSRARPPQRVGQSDDRRPKQSLGPAKKQSLGPAKKKKKRRPGSA